MDPETERWLDETFQRHQREEELAVIELRMLRQKWVESPWSPKKHEVLARIDRQLIILEEPELAIPF